MSSLPSVDTLRRQLLAERRRTDALLAALDAGAPANDPCPREARGGPQQRHGRGLRPRGRAQERLDPPEEGSPPVTIQRPDLTPAELQDARDAWMLVQLGQPIPTQYRPAAMKVAAYCFARGYDHDDAAEARPVFIHPDGGREGVPGVFGTNHTWTPTELAAWIAKHAGGMRAKGTGPMFSPGHSRVGDRPEGALTVPLPPLQRGDERCRELGWLFLDADDVGEWTPVLNAIGMHGGAFVRGRSGSHCPPDRKCTMHPKGQTKWHLAVPLRETWTPPGNLNVARATWKGELYAAARFAFHLVAEVSGRGFDRQLDQFLCRMYVGAPYDPKHFSVPREIHGQEGLGFDVRACWAGARRARRGRRRAGARLAGRGDAAPGRGMGRGERRAADGRSVQGRGPLPAPDGQRQAPGGLPLRVHAQRRRRRGLQHHPLAQREVSLLAQPPLTARPQAAPGCARCSRCSRPKHRPPTPPHGSGLAAANDPPRTHGDRFEQRRLGGQRDAGR
jgi:hypothetical protein